MGLTLHAITSLKLTDNSDIVTNFQSDVEITVGDVLNILGVDYQIKSIDADIIVLGRPYKYIGELEPDKMKIKKLPDYIKSQVKNTGEIVLITVEDLELQSTKDRGIKTPGWWHIITINPSRSFTELLVPVATHDEVELKPVIVKPKTNKPVIPKESTSSLDVT